MSRRGSRNSQPCYWVTATATKSLLYRELPVCFNLRRHPAPFSACPSTPPYHEAHSQTTTEATSVLFRARFPRPQDGRHRCRPLRRAPYPIPPKLSLTLPQVLNKVAGV